jgi:hypothetical protein
MDGLMLDTATLVHAAQAVGLTIEAVGSRLAVRGPRAAASLAALVLARKDEVLRLLDAQAPPCPPLAAWPPRADELATWPPPWREHWGRLANELEAQGATWNLAEREAFDRTARELAAHGLEHGPAERVQREADSVAMKDFRDIVYEVRQCNELAQRKRPQRKPEEPVGDQLDRPRGRPRHAQPDRPHSPYRPPHSRPAWNPESLPGVEVTQDTEPFNEF